MGSTRASGVIWGNFVLAVWISILYSAYELLFLARHVSAVNEFYGPFAPRVIFFPIVLGGGQLFLWLRVYRDRDVRARVLAGFVAGFFTLQLIIMGFQASVRLDIGAAHAALFAYLAISHALFAFRGS